MVAKLEQSKKETNHEIKMLQVVPPVPRKTTY
jgi:hypothetical protein